MLFPVCDRPACPGLFVVSLLRCLLAAVALLSGLIAKEAVVSTLSLLYGFSIGAAGTTVATALAATFTTPPGGLLLPGVYSALRPLRGGGEHHVP